MVWELEWKRNSIKISSIFFVFFEENRSNFNWFFLPFRPWFNSKIVFKLDKGDRSHRGNWAKTKRFSLLTKLFWMWRFYCFCHTNHICHTPNEIGDKSGILCIAKHPQLPKVISWSALAIYVVVVQKFDPLSWGVNGLSREAFHETCNEQPLT